MAPMTPDGAEVQEHELACSCSVVEGFFGPLSPFYCSCFDRSSSPRNMITRVGSFTNLSAPEQQGLTLLMRPLGTIAIKKPVNRIQ
jgi:hypothetical protein